MAVRLPDSISADRAVAETADPKTQEPESRTADNGNKVETSPARRPLLRDYMAVRVVS